MIEAEDRLVREAFQMSLPSLAREWGVPAIPEQEHQRLDRLETALLNQFQPVECPVTHRFTPGCYSREIFMPAGTLLTSKIHRTRHQYVVISGRASVYIPDVGVRHLEAGHVGITEPGTRRVLYIHEDCRWITFHPLDATEDDMLAHGDSEGEILAQIEGRIIERRYLPSGEETHAMYLELLAWLQLEGGTE